MSKIDLYKQFFEFLYSEAGEDRDSKLAPKFMEDEEGRDVVSLADVEYSSDDDESDRKLHYFDDKGRAVKTTSEDGDVYSETEYDEKGRKTLDLFMDSMRRVVYSYPEDNTVAKVYSLNDDKLIRATIYQNEGNKVIYKTTTLEFPPSNREYERTAYAPGKDVPFFQKTFNGNSTMKDSDGSLVYRKSSRSNLADLEIDGGKVKMSYDTKDKRIVSYTDLKNHFSFMQRDASDSPSYTYRYSDAGSMGRKKFILYTDGTWNHLDKDGKLLDAGDLSDVPKEFGNPLDKFKPDAEFGKILKKAEELEKPIKID